ncbi:hypothetical protein COOONC_24533, partial [Cooperia oncophora]
LDIATNKITKEEAEGIPHHMMSFVDAATARYNIHQFRAEGSENDSDGSEGLSELSNAELHQRLVEVDPDSARLVHPNNRARVLRAIQ